MIADDHTFMVDACQKLLEPEYDVVAKVGDGRALVRIAATLKPQVVIIDIGMPLLNGLDAGDQIKRILPSVKLIYLTMNTDPVLAAEAFRRGASGYLLKTCAASELMVAVREVLEGRSYLCPALAKETIDFFRQQKRDSIDERHRLTKRQREVLQLLAEGKSMKEVAFELRVTPDAVCKQKDHIKKTLNVTRSAELVKYAIRNHIIAA